MEIAYIIIALFISGAFFFAAKTYITSTYKNPNKALKHAEIYFNEMLYNQAKATLKRALKHNPNHPELIARLNQHEQENPNN